MGNITKVTVSDASFPFGYDQMQFDLCLDIPVLRDNLPSICEKVDDNDFQKVILMKLNQVILALIRPKSGWFFIAMHYHALLQLLYSFRHSRWVFLMRKFRCSVQCLAWRHLMTFLSGTSPKLTPWLHSWMLMMDHGKQQRYNLEEFFQVFKCKILWKILIPAYIYTLFFLLS